MHSKQREDLRHVHEHGGLGFKMPPRLAPLPLGAPGAAPPYAAGCLSLPLPLLLPLLLLLCPWLPVWR